MASRIVKACNGISAVQFHWNEKKNHTRLESTES